MGLLDYLQSPEAAFSMGLLDAAGPSRMPVSFGQALGRGMESMQQAKQVQQMQAFKQMQMDEFKRKLAQEQEQQGYQTSVIDSIQDPQMKAIVRAYPQLLPEMIKPKAPEKPQLVTVQTPNGPMQRWVRPGESQGADVGAPVDKESALPWYVRKGPDGSISIDPAYSELERTKASFSRPPAQPMAPVAYVNEQGQTVWGTITDAKGKPAANYNPTVQAAVTTAKTTAQETAKDQVEAKANLPKAIANGEEALSMIEEIRKHPGKNIAVGGSSILGIQHIPGTDAKDFVNRLEQVKSGAFLTAFETLKGGGQITQIEGEKATQALARMNNATSEKEFDSALNDYERIIRKAVNNAKLRAGSAAQAPSKGANQSGSVKFLGFE